MKNAGTYQQHARPGRDGGMAQRRARRTRECSVRRCLYAATCLISSGAILWGLVRMAMASPHYALVALAGALLILLARTDILLGALDQRDSRQSASDARTGTR